MKRLYYLGWLFRDGAEKSTHVRARSLSAARARVEREYGLITCWLFFRRIEE